MTDTRRDEEEEEEEKMHHHHHHHARHPSETPSSFTDETSSLAAIIASSAHSDTIKDETTFLSNQDEKIGHLERAIAFTEEDFVRPKFAHPTGTRGEQQQQQQQQQRHNASFITTCSILSLEDSALDVENGDAEAEALAARGRMYEQNTDLMGEEEEVDPRVETALEDMNDAAEKVNKAEREYERGKRTLREEKERAKETLDGMYKQLSGAVRKAVPALHKRAVASMYQNRSQEAMIAHAECFVHHQKCKRTVAKLERMLAKTREEETKGKDGTSSLSSSFSTDDDEEDEKERNDALTEGEEEEEEAGVTRACGNNGEDPKRATSPSASPTKNKKKKNRKKRLDKSNLRLLEKLSEAVNNVAEAERVMRRALFAHETNAKLAMEAVAECTRLSGDTRNIRAIVKAQRYFAIKKEGEDAVEKLESSVKEMRANVKTSKARYGECLEQLNAISNEIHERRELEKKTKALKLMKSSK